MTQTEKLQSMLVRMAEIKLQLGLKTSEEGMYAKEEAALEQIRD